MKISKLKPTTIIMSTITALLLVIPAEAAKPKPAPKPSLTPTPLACTKKLRVTRCKGPTQVSVQFQPGNWTEVFSAMDWQRAIIDPVGKEFDNSKSMFMAMPIRPEGESAGEVAVVGLWKCHIEAGIETGSKIICLK